MRAMQFWAALVPAVAPLVGKSRDALRGFPTYFIFNLHVFN